MRSARPEHEQFSGRRFDQLDGLRALAVGGVLFQHSLGLVRLSPDSDGFATGSVGVRLFFVLSGFLITGILLNARAQAEECGGSRLQIWRAFYCRRALRILPLAYLVLVLAWLMGAPTVRAHPWLYLTYTSNYFTAKAGFVDETLNHFWSLAIEEQFYLVWPLLVLAVPKRWLPAAMGAVVASALVARANVSAQAAYVLTATRLDALAVGGLLAWYQTRPRARTMPLVIVLACTGVCARLAPMLDLDFWIVPALPELGFVLLSAAIVIWAARGIGGVVGRALSAAPAVFIGTISYGVYVYHPVMASVTAVVSAHFGLLNPYPFEQGVPRLLWMLATTLPVATFSWYVFEKPLNNLKSHFPYVTKRTVPARPRPSPVPVFAEE